MKNCPIHSTAASKKSAIDKRLRAIGKDRQWLAAATGYTYFTIRDCLAPNGKKLSARMLAAIESAIAAQTSAPPASVIVPIEAPVSSTHSWNRAAADAGIPTHQWAARVLDQAAAREQTARVAEDPARYRTSPEP
jgi:hypothetical protein